MSKLDDLIKELCPNGVEYKKTNSFCEIKTGKGITSKDSSENGEYPIISGGKTPMGYYDKYNREGNTVTISRVGANAGFVLFLEEKFYLNDKCFSVIPFEEYKNIIIPKYLYYFFKNIENQIVALQSEGGVPTINTQKVGNLEIPVPPLPVQEEIVRILDTFISLTAELTAELTARRKQYEYYRDSLLTFDDSVEWKTLGDYCKFIRGPFGGSLKKECFVSEGYAVYEQQHAIYGKLNFRYHIDEKKFNELKRFEVAKNDLIVSCSGTIGRVMIIPEDAPKGVINQALLKLTPNENILPKYLKYFFESTITKELNESARGGAIQNVPSVGELKSIKLQVPSVKEQERIVKILDRFDNLCNDISSGLPAEIEARQKQYEYYRDKLLTFEKKKL